MQSTTGSLQKSIQRIIEAEAEKVKERLIAEAVKQYEADLRKAIGNAAINISNYFSVQQLRDELVIHVKIQAQG